jgi:hypothetical protein
MTDWKRAKHTERVASYPTEVINGVLELLGRKVVIKASSKTQYHSLYNTD